MDDLDDKLQELIFAGGHEGYISTDDAIDKIKKAFRDAGYVRRVTKGYNVRLAGDRLVPVSEGLVLMTSQEWYENLVLNLPVNKSMWDISEIKQSARLDHS